MVKWTDHHEKGKAAEILVMDAMSSEESCYEDNENGNPKVAKYSKKKLPWESRAMRKIKKKTRQSIQEKAFKEGKGENLEQN